MDRMAKKWMYAALVKYYTSSGWFFMWIGYFQFKGTHTWGHSYGQDYQESPLV